MALRMGIRVAVTVLVMCGMACADSNPASPSGALSATWTGAVVDSASGAGTAKLVLDQQGAAVSGTFLTTFGGVVGREGPTQGTAGASTVSLFFTPPAPLVCGAGVTLSGTLSLALALSGNRLTGSYSGLTCGGAATGTLDLTRQ